MRWNLHVWWRRHSQPFILNRIVWAFVLDERTMRPQSTFLHASVHSPAEDILIPLVEQHKSCSKLVPLGQINKIAVRSFGSFARSCSSLLDNNRVSFLETLPPSTYGWHRIVEEPTEYSASAADFTNIQIAAPLKNWDMLNCSVFPLRNQ